MRCWSVRPAELGDAELTRWRELLGVSAGGDNPFLAPEYALAVGTVRPQARVLVVEDADRVVGFFAHERHGSVATPIGSGLSDSEGWALDPAADVDAARALAAVGVTGWDFETLVEAQLPAGAYRTRRERSPVVQMPDGYDAYLETVRARSRKWLTSTFRKQRKLEREVGPVRFEFHLDPHGSDAGRAALDALLGWKSGQYAQLGEWDRFADPGIVALVNDLLETSSPTCSGALSMLYAGDRPIAGHAGLWSARTLSWWFPAYDPEFGRYSPGILLLLHLLEGAAEQGVGLVDLGRGAHDYKDATKTAELTVVTGSLDTPRLGSLPRRAKRVARAAVHTARGLRS